MSFRLGSDDEALIFKLPMLIVWTPGDLHTIDTLR